ncbi:MAG: hypothetical protein IKP71_12580, partial [Candidatus Riflebacteria bacterium]|nr:hypothetical protein [Candidatus Riflebacteria bacterium]
INNLGKQLDLIEKTKDHISFSFEFFTYSTKGGESFEDWQKEQILADLNNKLKHFSGKTCNELFLDKTLEYYSQFPEDSNFTIPQNLIGTAIRWARFRITGARRLIGVFFNNQYEKSKNVFYIVFLDKNHRFAPYKKKNT